jgi:hypothetical protein
VLPRRHVALCDSVGTPTAYSDEDGGALWIEIPHVATFHLAAGATSVTAFVDDAASPDSVRDAFYGSALPLAVQAAHGFEILHGSAVLAREKGWVAAFCGASGVGKSTVAYGLSSRGHRQWADDAVAFAVGPSGEVCAAALPYEVKLREASSEFFDSTPGGLAPTGGRVVVGGSDEVRAPLGAVFLLERVDVRDRPEPVSVARLAAAEALHSLLPNAFRFQPESWTRRRRTIRSYLELAAAVPVLRARYSSDLARLPELLDALECSFDRLD